MKNTVAILEDDENRAEAMCNAITAMFPRLDVLVFNNAPDMIEWISTSVELASLISLDHDLGANRQRQGKVFDPGTGRDVVDLLISLPPVCPVIIHTSNSTSGDGMQFALEDAGWKTARVVPMGDLGWIKAEWHEKVSQLVAL
jgi:hypothetical protein